MENNGTSKKQRSLISWEEFPDQIQSVLKGLLTSGDDAINFWLGDRILTTGFDDGDLFRIN